MIKISICGQANSGKNTISRMLCKEILKIKPQTSYQYLAFADPIKKMGQIMFPSLPKKYFFGSSKYRSQIIPGSFKEGVPLTVRQLLIDIGNKLGRSYNNTVWIDVFNTNLEKSIKSKDLVIITDVRRINEFSFLKEKNFFQIKVYRNNNIKLNDVSETEQNSINDADFDYVLNNNGNLKDLKEEVKKIIQLIVN